MISISTVKTPDFEGRSDWAARQIVMLPAILALTLLAPMQVSADSLPDGDDSNRNILESTQKRENARTSNIAKTTCREIAPDSETHDVALPPGALDKLIAHAGFGYGIFSGTLHNANPEYTVTQITVLITPAGKRSTMSQSETGNEYNLPLELKPNSTGSLSLLLPSDHTREYSWKITKACGHRVR